jgi:hypothetical protein
VHRLTDALAQVDAKVRSMSDELAAAKYHVAALLSSASWRWMAPLRAAKRIVSGSEQ